MCLRGGGVSHNRRAFCALLLKYPQISGDGGRGSYFFIQGFGLEMELNHGVARR